MLRTRHLIHFALALLCQSATLAHAAPMPAAYVPALHQIYQASKSPGMVASIIDGEHIYTAGFGRTSPSNRALPNEKTLLRINSLSKLMTAQILAHLESEGKIKLADKLNTFAPRDHSGALPRALATITLRDLLTHTSGIARDVPMSVWRAANPRDERWLWLKTKGARAQPHAIAEYSNAAYLFLGDALERASAQPYKQLLSRYVTAPFGLHDTSLAPTPKQCQRLLSATRQSCDAGHATAGSWGIYSTSDDIAHWLQALMRAPQGSPMRRSLESLVERRQVKEMRSLDFAGPADAIGWGWLFMSLDGKRVLQKTGGGARTMNYVIMSPHEHKALFITVARMDIEMLRRLSASANQLMTTIMSEPH